ncbi:MAG: acyltransferase, partial [Acidobacteria bacterium]|nr:acyltransferase [Acidobacteriota bacterium]
MRNVRVASVQFEHAPGDKRANLAKIRSFVEQAAREKVEIIAFPECCITGYWFLRNLPEAEFAALAEPVFAGPSSREL